MNYRYDDEGHRDDMGTLSPTQQASFQRQVREFEERLTEALLLLELEIAAFRCPPKTAHPNGALCSCGNIQIPMNDGWLCLKCLRSSSEADLPQERHPGQNGLLGRPPGQRARRDVERAAPGVGDHVPRRSEGEKV